MLLLLGDLKLAASLYVQTARAEGRRGLGTFLVSLLRLQRGASGCTLLARVNFSQGAFSHPVRMGGSFLESDEHSSGKEDEITRRANLRACFL